MSKTIGFLHFCAAQMTLAHMLPPEKVDLGNLLDAACIAAIAAWAVYLVIESVRMIAGPKDD